MEITSARLTYGLNARATSSQPNISGDIQIGSNLTSLSLDVTKAYSLKAFCPDGGSFTFDPTTGAAEETTDWGVLGELKLLLEGVGTVVGDGTIEINIGGFNWSSSVPVSNGDTPVQWIEKVVTQLNAEFAAETSYDFRLRRDGTSLIFESNPVAETPGTITELFSFTLALVEGATGIEPAEATIIYPDYKIHGGEGKDFDGIIISPMAPKAILIESSTPFEVQIGVSTLDIPANGVILLKEVPSETAWTFTAVNEGWIEITVAGQ